MKSRSVIKIAILFLNFGAVASLAHRPTVESNRPDANQPQSYQLSGDDGGAHDPSIMKEGDTWYVFTSGKDPNGGHIPIRCSTDLHVWKHCGSVFAQLPAWLANDPLVPHAQGIWAPDISWFDGQFHLYYAYSLFGKNTSGIGLATNVTLDPRRPDYKWVDQGLVLRSVAADSFNAIDPNLVIDKRGNAWLDFGSFWTGIKMRSIDRRTGKLSLKNSKLYSLASRARPGNAEEAPPNLPANWQAVEAPFLVPHGKYYYLFVSWDLCCRGTRSTYRTMIGRARNIIGPYLDKNGTSMDRGGGSELLTANAAWLGPGGESVYLGTGQSLDLLVYHAYDASTGKPFLQISTLTWENGWPHATLPKSNYPNDPVPSN